MFCDAKIYLVAASSDRRSTWGAKKALLLDAVVVVLVFIATYAAAYIVLRGKSLVPEDADPILRIAPIVVSVAFPLGLLLSGIGARIAMTASDRRTMLYGVALLIGGAATMAVSLGISTFLAIEALDRLLRALRTTSQVP